MTQSLMTPQNYGPCACMGPRLGDPHCPCVMRQKGLTPSLQQTPLTPEEKAKLSAMFNREIK